MVSMSNGLLAWWHRRTASCGLAGAALCAVPVAVAVLIGFGGSFSGVTSGLAALTSGPDATPATPPSAQTDPTDPKGLNRAVLALATRTGSSVRSNSGLGSTTGAGRGPTGNGLGPGTSDPGGSGGGPGASTISTHGESGGSGGSSGGGSSGSPTITVPDVSLPGTGGATDTANSTVDSVNNTVDSVNNTVDSVNNTVNGLLGP
jgi:hypothetical protein